MSPGDVVAIVVWLALVWVVLRVSGEQERERRAARADAASIRRHEAMREALR